jgi:hypothetical protein
MRVYMLFSGSVLLTTLLFDAVEYEIVTQSGTPDFQQSLFQPEKNSFSEHNTVEDEGIRLF